jgi:tetratricopeptide (TPR) repeat protein
MTSRTHRNAAKAACRQLRANMMIFVDIFVALNGRLPNGATEHDPFPTTYAPYQDLDRLIKEDAASVIQQFVRGALVRGAIKKEKHAIWNAVKGMQESGDAAMAASQRHSAIHAYSEAIRLLSVHPGLQSTNDALAMLHARRASALSMLWAYNAACSDFVSALHLVPVSLASDVSGLCGGKGLAWQAEQQLGLAYAQLRMGDYESAERTCQGVEQLGHHDLILGEKGSPITTIISYMAEATLGQQQASHLREHMKMAQRCFLASMECPSDKQAYCEILVHVEAALTIAPTCENLIAAKVKTLATLQRWRELAGYCERLAAFTVSLDDLPSEFTPFPGVSPARYLKAEVFRRELSETATTAALQLKELEVKEAVLRLPHSVVQFYIRSLVLEERYPEASTALAELRSLVVSGKMTDDSVPWLPKEIELLVYIKHACDTGNSLYSRLEFEAACKAYTLVLMKIDLAGESGYPTLRGEAVRGRLHANMHYKRALCFFALNNPKHALEECNRALVVHPQFMKVILQKCRCFVLLQRYDEATIEFWQWIVMAKEALENPLAASSPIAVHLFEGPQLVSAEDLKRVRWELSEVITVSLALAQGPRFHHRGAEHANTQSHANSHSSPESTPNHNELLGVSKSASEREIKSAQTFSARKLTNSVQVILRQVLGQSRIQNQDC